MCQGGVFGRRAFSLFSSLCRSEEAAWRKTLFYKDLEACESQINVCVGGRLRPEGLLIVFQGYMAKDLPTLRRTSTKPSAQIFAASRGPGTRRTRLVRSQQTNTPGGPFRPFGNFSNGPHTCLACSGFRGFPKTAEPFRELQMPPRDLQGHARVF